MTDVLHRALEAVAATRDTGGFFHAHLLGVRGGSTGRGTTELSVPAAPGRQRPSVVAVATLADLALGSALRSALGAGLLLPTVELSLTLTRPALGAVRARARALPAHGSLVTAWCDLADDAGPLGVASGTFATGRQQSGRPMPWDAPATALAGPARPAVLTADEQACVDAAVEAAEAVEAGEAASPGAGHDDAVQDALLQLATERFDAGSAAAVAVGRAVAGPATANRAGHLHGGAVIALAVRTVQALLDPGAAHLHSVGVQFLQPAAGPLVSARATTRRSGRRLLVASADVSSGAATAATALVSLAVSP